MTKEERASQLQASNQMKFVTDIRKKGTPTTVHTGVSKAGCYDIAITEWDIRDGVGVDSEGNPRSDFFQITFEFCASGRKSKFAIMAKDIPFAGNALATYTGDRDIAQSLQALIDTQTPIVLEVNYVAVKG